MMEALPAAALIMPEANFLLEVVIVALDAPPQFGEIDEAAERHVGVNGCEPIFGGLGLALGPFDEQCLLGETSPRIGATRTRTRAKRDCSFALVPSRHVMVRQECLGRPSAKASTLTRGGFGSSLRTRRTLTVDTMAAT